MNFGMMNVLVGSHIDGIQRQAGSLRTGACGRGSRPATEMAGRAGLRHWIGFALVEAGLHLMATGRPEAGSRMPLNQRS